MKKITLYIIFILLSAEISFAKTNPYNVGDIIKDEVIYSKKVRIPLPPGEFIVGVKKRTKEFHDMMIYQVDKKTGITRWAIWTYATGAHQWEWWNVSKWCKRTNVYFIKKYNTQKDHSCWMINHYRSDITTKKKGFWNDVRNFEINSNLKNPDIWVGAQYTYSKGPRKVGVVYYYNPELDGVPKPVNLEWTTNEFHMQRVKKYPKHKEFLEKFKSVSAALIERFNINNNVRGKLTLNVEEFITNASINSETQTNSKKKTDNNNTTNKDLIGKLKELKELKDAGILNEKEFEKAKSKLLN